jgi:hypothetical protein
MVAGIGVVEPEQEKWRNMMEGKHSSREQDQGIGF